ncbi:hypothetical protein JCM11251_006649 [Rhodosporidiobolus azoricus]
MAHALAFRLHGPSLPEKVTKLFRSVITATSGIQLQDKNAWKVKEQVKNEETGKWVDKRKTFTWRNPELYDPDFDYLAEREGKVECKDRDSALQMAVNFNRTVLRPFLDYRDVDFQEQARHTVSVYNCHVLGIDGQSRPIYLSISQAQGIGLNLMVRNGTLTVQSSYEDSNRTVHRHFFIGPDLDIEGYTPGGKKLYKVPDLSDDSFDLAAFAASVKTDFDAASAWTPPVKIFTLEELAQQPPKARQAWGFRRPDSLKYPGTAVAAKNLPMDSWLQGALGGDGDHRCGYLYNNHQEEVIKKLLEIAKKMGGQVLHLGGIRYGIYKTHPQDPRIIHSVDAHLLATAAKAEKAMRFALVEDKTNVWRFREGELIYEMTGPTSELEAKEMYHQIKECAALEKEQTASASASSDKKGSSGKASSATTDTDDENSNSEGSNEDSADEECDSGIEVSPAPRRLRAKNLIRPILKQLQQQPKKGQKGPQASQKHINASYFKTTRAEQEKVLGGAFDTDGHLRLDDGSAQFIFTQALAWHKRFFEDTALLAALLGHSVRFSRRPSRPYRVLDVYGRVISQGMSGEQMVVTVTRQLEKVGTVMAYKKVKKSMDKAEKNDFGFYALKKVSPGVEIEDVYDIKLEDNDADVDILRPDFLTFKPSNGAQEAGPPRDDEGDLEVSLLVSGWTHSHFDKGKKAVAGKEEDDPHMADDEDERGNDSHASNDVDASGSDSDTGTTDTSTRATKTFAGQLQRFKRPAAPLTHTKAKKPKLAGFDSHGLDAYLARQRDVSGDVFGDGNGRGESVQGFEDAAMEEDEEEGDPETPEKTLSTSDRLKGFLCRKPEEK